MRESGTGVCFLEAGEGDVGCRWIVEDVEDVEEGGSIEDVDELGVDSDGERLEVYLHRSLYDGVDMLEAGEVFAIQESWFTVNYRGEAMVRVDSSV